MAKAIFKFKLLGSIVLLLTTSEVAYSVNMEKILLSDILSIAYKEDDKSDYLEEDIKLLKNNNLIYLKDWEALTNSEKENLDNCGLRNTLDEEVYKLRHQINIKEILKVHKSDLNKIFKNYEFSTEDKECLKKNKWKNLTEFYWDSEKKANEIPKSLSTFLLYKYQGNALTGIYDSKADKLTTSTHGEKYDVKCEEKLHNIKELLLNYSKGKESNGYNRLCEKENVVLYWEKAKNNDVLYYSVFIDSIIPPANVKLLKELHRTKRELTPGDLIAINCVLKTCKESGDTEEELMSRWKDIKELVTEMWKKSESDE